MVRKKRTPSPDSLKYSLMGTSYYASETSSMYLTHALEALRQAVRQVARTHESPPDINSDYKYNDLFDIVMFTCQAFVVRVVSDLIAIHDEAEGHQIAVLNGWRGFLNTTVSGAKAKARAEMAAKTDATIRLGPVRPRLGMTIGEAIWYLGNAAKHRSDGDANTGTLAGLQRLGLTTAGSRHFTQDVSLRGFELVTEVQISSLRKADAGFRRLAKLMQKWSDAVYLKAYVAIEGLAELRSNRRFGRMLERVAQKQRSLRDLKKLFPKSSETARQEALNLLVPQRGPGRKKPSGASSK